MDRWVGLDFGTTNSAIAVVDRGEPPKLARFETHQGISASFRSLLYFTKQVGVAPRAWAGPDAIHQYQNAEEPGRLVQSLKSYLTSDSLQSTNIFGKIYSLEELVAVILVQLRRNAEAELGPVGKRAVVGCPVRFVGGKDDASNAFARERLRKALALAGFDEVRFVFEPVAAAHAYRRRLDHDELVLIADFGGGTTDFSLVRLTPLDPGHPEEGVTILGTGGIPIAGDCFDGRIVSAVVSPSLGQGSEYRSEMEKMLPVPVWLYTHLRRWHHVSFLRARKTVNMLKNITRTATNREGLEALYYLIENDLGFALHRSVQASKFALSKNRKAEFNFADGPIGIRELLYRSDFETWIFEDLESVEKALDELIDACRIDASAVDTVFMTGGSSLVPSVQEIFRRRFGSEKLRAGDELTTVAKGLALCAASGQH